MLDNLEGLAGKVLIARAAVEQSAAATALASEHRNTVADRVRALAGEREAIVTRRGAGHLRAEDGASLELIAADTESLRTMLSEAEAAHTAAAAAAGHVCQVHAAAEAAYQAEEQRLALLKLDQHAARLFSLFVATLTERRATASAFSPADRALGNVTNRLAALDGIICAEMTALQGLRRGPAPHPFQPIWKPSDTLYDAVMRLHQVDGYSYERSRDRDG